MKIPKLQTAFLPLTLRSDNTRVDNTRAQMSYQNNNRQVRLRKKLKLDSEKQAAARRMLSITVSADNRTDAKRRHDQKQAEVKTKQMRKEQEKAENLLRFEQVVDAAIKLTRPSTYEGYVLTDHPFGEGFGNEAANIAGDLLAGPLAALTKTIGKQGFKYAWKAIPRVSLGRNAEAALPVVQPSLLYQYHPIEVGGRRPYISPATERVSITTADPIMAHVQPSEKDIHNTLMNVAMKASRLSQLGKLGKTQVEEFVERLSPYLSRDQAKQFIKRADFFLKGDKTALAIEQKALKNSKGKRGLNVAINDAIQAEKASTPEGRLQSIRDKYLPLIDKSTKETGIDWSDLNNLGMMAGMDTDLKLTPVGGHSESFIKRYYDNVTKYILGENGFLAKILKSGDLRINPQTKQWEGKYPDGKYYPVRRPEEYIKIRYARDVKGADVELPIPDETYHGFPMHGTMTKNIEYLIQLSTHPGKNGYWTVIGDKLGFKSAPMEYYKGKGYSVPFYRSPSLESEPFKNGTSYNLMDLMHNLYNGKVMQPTFVKDANAPQGLINEYIFGPTAPNPKSAWNTLDFAPGAGPLAYTPTKITVTGNNFA